MYVTICTTHTISRVFNITIGIEANHKPVFSASKNDTHVKIFYLQLIFLIKIHFVCSNKLTHLSVFDTGISKGRNSHSFA